MYKKLIKMFTKKEIILKIKPIIKMFKINLVILKLLTQKNRIILLRVNMINVLRIFYHLKFKLKYINNFYYLIYQIVSKYIFMLLVLGVIGNVYRLIRYKY